MKACLFVGDISLDLSLSASHVPAPDEKVHCSAASEGVGGVVTNTAVAFAKAGGQAVLAVQVGDDPASEAIGDQLNYAGLDFRPHRIAGGLCRVVTILEPHGEKRLLLYPGVSIFPDERVIEALNLAGLDHLHTACFGPAAHALVAHARAEGMTWSIDLEPATFRNGIGELVDVLAGAELVFVNDRAADAIGADALTQLLALGVKAIIRSRGPLGAEYHSPGAAIAARPPEGLQIVDTTGAGDCLAGWFLAGRAAGLSLETALGRAVNAATFSCGRIGAQTGYPTPRDIQNFSIRTEEVA